MQECFKKSTNFAHSQWLVRDLYAQGGGVRSDPQKGGHHLHVIDNPNPQ